MSEKFVIRGVGDMLFVPQAPDWDRPKLAALVKLLNDADVAFGNLESPLVDHGVPIPKVDIARADVAMIEVVTRLGFQVVSIGNNHIMDYGVDGMHSTQRALFRANVHYAGAGHCDHEAFAPTYFGAGGRTVAFLSCLNCYSAGIENYLIPIEATGHQAGAACIPGYHIRVPGGSTTPVIAPSHHRIEMLVKSIEQARKKADVVIVSMHTHWGADTSAVDVGRQVIAHAAIDAGADLILGHGPHAINGIEYYKERFIVHSMGNFFFHIPCGILESSPDSRPFVGAMMNDERFWLAMMVEAVFDGEKAPKELVIHPIEISRDEKTRGVPHLASGRTINHVRAILAPQCQALGVTVTAQKNGTLLAKP